MKGFRMIFFIFLVIFWIALAGISWQSIGAGLLAVVFALWLNRGLIDSLLERKRFFQGKKALILLGYGLSLLWHIVLANIQVAKLVLNPKMPLQPTIVTFNPGLSTDLSKTILANSITLTPGTLTIDVAGDEFTVHALTLAAAQDVVEWPLIAWLRRMEEE